MRIGGFNNYKLMRLLIPISLITMPLIVFNLVRLFSSSNQSSILKNSLDVFTSLMDFHGEILWMRTSLMNGVIYGNSRYSAPQTNMKKNIEDSYKRINNNVLDLFEENQPNRLGKFTDRFQVLMRNTTVCQLTNIGTVFKLCDAAQSKNNPVVLSKNILYVMKEVSSTLHEMREYLDKEPQTDDRINLMISSPRFESIFYMDLWSHLTSAIKNGLAHEVSDHISTLTGKEKLEEIDCGSSCGFTDTMRYDASVIIYILLSLLTTIITSILLQSFVDTSLVEVLEANTCSSLFISARTISENLLLTRFTS